MMVFRTTRQIAWWGFGLGLVFAAWWGLPLIESDQLQNHFFGLFWYSMLGMGALFWAVPAEQRVSATQVERHYCLFGLIALWKQAQPLSDFQSIVLEQDPNLFRRDTVWVLLKSEAGQSFVFARFTATQRGIAQAQQIAQDLAALTGLAIAPPQQDAAE